MADGEFEEFPDLAASLTLSNFNFGRYPMCNDLSRLATRFLGKTQLLSTLHQLTGKSLLADQANDLGLVSNIYDDIDWYDEIRVFIEERSSFSADAMTGLEANLRFAGPETMQTKIFGRLTAWQNWIFQRPNATGEQGALERYGSGKKAEFNRQRV
jgi:benzoyl-CoA-dihydrodiol lyase